MRILIVDDAGQDRAATENAFQERDVETRRADDVLPIERLYLFAGWTLEETARDLVIPVVIATDRREPSLSFRWM
jgi:hypothetical protein